MNNIVSWNKDSIFIVSWNKDSIFFEDVIEQTIDEANWDWISQ